MSRRRRIVFYSHDSFGLGHFRRSVTIASYLARHIDGLSILMLTGCDSPAVFDAPPGIDFVKLPSVSKIGPDEYRSRHLRVSLTRVVRMREQLIRTVMHSFDPEMVVVDNVPRGIDGELLPVLRYLRRHRPNVRLVLTLRDILDVPEQIVPQWQELGVYDVLRRFYDEIWVAGSAAVFDPVRLYELPADVAEKVKFCGYVVRSSPPGDEERLRQEIGLGERKLVVASCGGGGDGYALLDAYASVAAPLAEDGVLSAVFLGPDMPPSQRQALKQRLLPLSQRVLTYDFRPDLVTFLSLASCSVSMAGYNTTCEIVSSGVPAVLVPREYPRLEQLLRAQAFADRGLVRLLRAPRLRPDTLREMLLAELRQPAAQPAETQIDFAGLSRITRRVRKHLGLSQSS